MKKNELNLAAIKEIFETCDDILFQPIQFENTLGHLIYIEELVNPNIMTQIEQGLTTFQAETKKTSIEMITSFLKGTLFPIKQMNEIDKKKQEMVQQILHGNTVLFIQNTEDIYIFQTSNRKSRLIKEPPTEQVVRGPREGFVEDIQTNLMLIRTKLRNPLLKVKYVTLGVQTQTKIAILYIKDIASDDIVKEVERRVSKIEIDGILESKYIEDFIQDTKFSTFPLLNHTERPDNICAKLLEGKVAIITDGTPTVLSAPAVFVEFLHTSDDYYKVSITATITRWVRALGLFVALILPAFICAVTTIHQDLLQTPLLLRIASYHEDLPYPILVEMVFMLITFELIREAGLRIPKVYGNAAITILGLILISQAAIQAGIIGTVSMVAISTTALTTFIIPNYSMQQMVGIFRFPMLFLGGTLGLMGIIVGIMFILAYLCSLRSFGVPYLSPMSPARKEGWKDVFIRAPRWAMDTRPPGFDIPNIKRLGKTAKENQDE